MVKHRRKPKYNRPASLLERAITLRRESGGINGYYKAHQKFCKEQLRIMKKNEKKNWKLKHQLLAELLTIEGALACAIDKRHEAIRAKDYGIKNEKGVKRLRKQSSSWFSRVISRLKDPDQLRVTLESDQKRLGVETLDITEGDHTWLIYRNLVLAHVQNNVDGSMLENKFAGANHSKQCLTACLHYLSGMGPKPLFSSSRGYVPDLDAAGYSLMLSTMEAARATQENDDSIDFSYIQKLNKRSVDLSESNAPTETLRFLYNSWSSEMSLADLPNLKNIVNLFKSSTRSNLSIFNSWHLTYYEHKEQLAEDDDAKKRVRKCQLRLNRPYIDMVNTIKDVRDEINDSLSTHQKESTDRLDSITYTSLNIERAAITRRWNTWLCLKDYELECERLLVIGLVVLSHSGVDIEAGSFKSILKLPSKWTAHYQNFCDRTEKLMKMTTIDDDSEDHDLECSQVTFSLLISLMGGELMREQVELVFNKVSPILEKLKYMMPSNTEEPEWVKSGYLQKLSQKFTLESCSDDRLDQLISIYEGLFAYASCDEETELEQSKYEFVLESVTPADAIADVTVEEEVESDDGLAKAISEEYLAEEEDIFDDNNGKSVDTTEEGHSIFKSFKRAFWG